MCCVNPVGVNSGAAKCINCRPLCSQQFQFNRLTSTHPYLWNAVGLHGVSVIASPVLIYNYSSHLTSLPKYISEIDASPCHLVIGVNISERKSGTERTKKRKKRELVFFPPPGAQLVL